MTVTAEKARSAWQTQPGWGISVDLTPREVVQARQTQVYQRLIGLGLLLVLILCAGVGLLQHSAQARAQGDYDAEQARTASLAAETQQYADVAAMQELTTRVQGDLATVMTSDVDVVHLMARINQAVPAGVEINSQAVVLTPPEPVVAAPVDDPAAGTATDTAAAPTAAPVTGPQVIGTLTVAGTAESIDDVTPFVASLTQLRGAVDVLPASVARTDTGATYSITMNLTDVLYTGRYNKEGSP
jgi:Tfp pilus assembly protein PilN